MFFFLLDIWKLFVTRLLGVLSRLAFGSFLVTRHLGVIFGIWKFSFIARHLSASLSLGIVKHYCH